jgi:hypothetical protein
MRFVAASVACLVAGCATSESTVFVGPPCAKVTSDDAHNLTDSSVILPSGLPFTSRSIDIKYADGKDETRIVNNNQIDLLRGSFGCCALGLGALNLTEFLLIKTDNVTASTELYVGGAEAVFGAELLLLGWHPDQNTLSYDGRCAEIPPPKPMPVPTAPAPPPSQPTQPPSATPAPP